MTYNRPCVQESGMLYLQKSVEQGIESVRESHQIRIKVAKHGKLQN